MSDVDEMVSTLDERYGRHNWNLWSASIGGWVVKLNKEKTSHYGDTIGEALQAAIDHKPLPVVPRRPSLFFYLDADIYKAGSSGWRIKFDCRDCGACFKTKKAAQQWARQEEERSVSSYNNWVDNHGWTLGKQEGVDFRYE
jgi:hypothetical protein